MWRYSDTGAIEPDFLAINMGSPIGRLAADYLVLFTARICELKKVGKTEKEMFVNKGVDAHVIRRYVGEHLNYAITGLIRSMSEIDEFRGGFNFGEENILGTVSNRKQGDDKTSSSWESVMKINNESELIHLDSPVVKALYHRALLMPYNQVISDMKTFASCVRSKTAVDTPLAASSSGMFKAQQIEPKKAEVSEIKHEELNKPQSGVK